MHFVFIGTYNPANLDIRNETRPAHMDFLNGYTDQILCAGPTSDADGTMTGSVLIAEFESLAVAEAWTADDPYTKAGVFEKMRVTAWKKVLPTT